MRPVHHPNPRDWFWLYRPAAPSHRAQSVQVIHSAWAMAARGDRVELCVQGGGSVAEILAAYGLSPLGTLRLRVLPRHNAAASWAYRAALVGFAARTRGQGIVLARNKRHAAWVRKQQAIESCPQHRCAPCTADGRALGRVTSCVKGQCTVLK